MGLTDYDRRYCVPPIQAAFRKLAYKKFMHMPLYLEWAPADIFGEDDQSNGVVAAPSSKQRAGKEADADDDDENEASSTLFVKNLNFETTNDTLEAAFKKRINGVRSAKVGPIFVRTCTHAYHPRSCHLMPRWCMALLSDCDENGPKTRRSQHWLRFCGVFKCGSRC